MQQLWLYTVLGLTTGGAYALTSVGLVTVYRGSGCPRDIGTSLRADS